MVNQEYMAQLEAIADELMTVFEVHAPPVPIETMLQNAPNGMWDTVDVNQLSGTFLSVTDQYSPRMSLARLLARHIANSAWGQERNLLDILSQDEQYIRAFARMIIMPREMINSMTGSMRTPGTINLEFEVPEDDAKKRLAEIT
jgi:hypothetical protein